MIDIGKLKQDVLSGESDPLTALATAKDYLKEVSEAVKVIELEALEEASKYEKTFEYKGFKFERRNGSKRFDFKHLKEWDDKKKELGAVESKYKAAFNSFQLNLTSSTDDGEVIELPKVTMGKDSLIVKEIK